MFVLSIADFVWTRTGLARPNRRCSAIGETPSEWGSLCGRYGTRICRCCSSSGRIRSPYRWPPLRRPTTGPDAFERRWSRLRADETVLTRLSVVDDDVAGTIGSWGEAGEREVTYWIGRSYWGKGIPTDALTAFLGC
jgi:hypothetical protein